MRNGIKLIETDIAQGFCWKKRAGFALLATGIVLAAHQCAFEVTVNDHNRHALRHGNGFGAQRTAVDQQRTAFFPSAEIS